MIMISNSNVEDPPHNKEEKKNRSLLVSPELYVHLSTGWFILSPEKTVNRRLSWIDLFSYHPPVGSTMVALDWGIYVISGYTSDVKLLDCRTNTWRHVCSMRVARVYPAAGVIDGKIYVFGGIIEDDYTLSYGEVFDPKTQTWDKLVQYRKYKALRRIHASFVLEGKVYAVENERKRTRNSQTLCYSPSDECKWVRRKHSKPSIQIYRCVTIEKLLYCLDVLGKLFWCENDEFKWKEVKGLDLEELFGMSSGSRFYEVIRKFGEKNIVIFWRVGDIENSKTRCAEISLERRKDGDEIWGKVEWSDRT